MRSFSSIALVALATVLGACSSGGAPARDGAADAAGGDVDAPGDATTETTGPTLYGGVTVEVIKDDHTSFQGLFFDGPKPSPMPLDAKQSQGGCTLFVPRLVSCAQRCASGTECTDTDQCSRTPALVDVGALHVEGLGGAPRDSMATSEISPNYQLVPTLPYPACAEGAAISVTADAFTLVSTCVAALDVTSTVPIPVVSGQPVHLAWTPAAQPGLSRVAVELEISHHGGYAGEVDCDVADTGAFDIPAPLVTALVALGRAGYPTVRLARTATATAPTQPHVKLDVTSRAEVDVDTGVISCGADGSPPCATGTTCQTDFTCR